MQHCLTHELLYFQQYSKLAIKSLEQGVKHVQNNNKDTSTQIPAGLLAYYASGAPYSLFN